MANGKTGVKSKLFTVQVVCMDSRSPEMAVFCSHVQCARDHSAFLPIPIPIAP